MKIAVALSALALAQGAFSLSEFSQCGGINGITGTCDSGLSCVVMNPYFYQYVLDAWGWSDDRRTRHRSVRRATTTTKSTTKKTSTTTKITTTTKTATGVPSGVSTKLPASSGHVSLPTASVIKGTFDGGMKRFDRAGSSGDCQEQTETGEADAVFILESSATIQNVIIGSAQAEGLHCRDAITLKQTGANDVSYIIGGGAFYASDKIVQHNGAGTVSIKNFYANDFGKLYRACGNCPKSYERHVIIDGVALVGGSTGVGINENFGDTAVIF
ncbi:hypothetical protein FRB90_000259 [Tulasnella sp. 427]|nr:hypothetical protein FRB90_000259 [Tulasnella sp. 427]